MAIYHLIVSAIVVQTTLSLNPGFKTLITEKGLRYADSIAKQALAKMLEERALPDSSGTAAGARYTLTRMRINGFRNPSGTMKFHPGSGIKWSASGDTITLRGDFSYTKRMGWIDITDRGSFVTTMNGVSFSLDLAMDKDSRGHPTISAIDCDFRVGSIHVKLSGTWAWLYNIFHRIIENKLKDQMKPKFCDAAKRYVNQDGNKRLSEIPVEVPLREKFIWDNQLVSKPHFAASYMETMHKGEIFWKSDPKEAPFSPKITSSGSGSSKMLYLWLSEYVANTMGYAAHRHGYMTYLISPDTLPPGNRSFLNTTCSSVCIGKLIPEIAKKYPHSMVKLELKSTMPPSVEIHSSHVGLTGGCNVMMYAQESGGQEPLMLTLNVNATGKVTISLDGQILKGHVLSASLKTKIVKSNIGKLDEFHVNDVMNLALRFGIIPTVNKYGEAGMFLPVSDLIKFVNPKLTLVEDTIVVDTDVVYEPKSMKNAAKTESLASHFDSMATSHQVKPLPPVDPVMIFKEINRRRSRHFQKV